MDTWRRDKYTLTWRISDHQSGCQARKTFWWDFDIHGSCISPILDKVGFWSCKSLQDKGIRKQQSAYLHNFRWIFDHLHLRPLQIHHRNTWNRVSSFLIQEMSPEFSWPEFSHQILQIVVKNQITSSMRLKISSEYLKWEIHIKNVSWNGLVLTSYKISFLNHPTKNFPQIQFFLIFPERNFLRGYTR